MGSRGEREKEEDKQAIAPLASGQESGQGEVCFGSVQTSEEANRTL